MTLHRDIHPGPPRSYDGRRTTSTIFESFPCELSPAILKVSATLFLRNLQCPLSSKNPTSYFLSFCLLQIDPKSGISPVADQRLQYTVPKLWKKLKHARKQAGWLFKRNLPGFFPDKLISFFISFFFSPFLFFPFDRSTIRQASLQLGAGRNRASYIFEF